MQDKLESEETTRNPDLEIAQLKFELTLPEYHDDENRIKKLKETIIREHMSPFYELVCQDLNWNLDETLLSQLREENDKVLKQLDDEIEFATKNSSAIEVKEAYLSKAKYYSKIGDKDNALKTLAEAFDRTVALGCKLDNVFHCIRIGLFFKDFSLIKANLHRAESLIAQGANWHSRNCYKICKALYSLVSRDFHTAATLLVDAISTFVCTELIAYDTFIQYTIIVAMVTLHRGQIKDQLIDNPDIQQALHSNNTTLKEYLYALQKCEYRLFFSRLADIEVLIKHDILLHPHYRYYVKEMKVKAYDQLLSSYKSVKIDYMAGQFGVSEDFIENEVGRLIAAGRLSYKIDKVNGAIVNVPKDKKTLSLDAVLKHGDLLLNRIHKLGRVINI